MAGRKDKRGRIGEGVTTLFGGGLLKEAGTGHPIYLAMQTRGTTAKGRQRKRVLVVGRSLDGAAPSVSFPHCVFEEALLRLLAEVDPADVLGEEPAGETTALAASLARVDMSIEAIVDELEANGESAVLFKRLREKEAEKRDLAGRLAAARRRERTPRTAIFAEASTLFGVAVGEDRRLRLRGLLRQLIAEISILIVRRRSHALLAAQVYFEGGGRRDYLIWYQPKAHCRPGGWLACSLPAEIGPDDLDLRREADAGGLRRLLSEIDLALLIDAMRARPD
jgi:hypothetical protein